MMPDDYDAADESIRYDLCPHCGQSEGHREGCPDDGIDELIERGPADD